MNICLTSAAVKVSGKLPRETLIKANLVEAPCFFEHS